MEKNRKIMMTCALMAVLVTACEPMSKKKEQINIESLAQIDTSVPKNVEKHLKMEITDNIKIDADIVGLTDLEEYKLPEYDCTLHCFDESEILDLLCDYYQIDGSEQDLQLTEEKLPNGEPVRRIEYIDQTGNSAIQVRTTYAWGKISNPLNAIDVEFDQNFYDLAINGLTSYKESVSKDIDLKFMTIDDAESKAREFVESMGVDLIDDRNCYSATYEDFAKHIDQHPLVQQQYKDIGITSSQFDESMDAYHFDFLQGYRNVSIMQYSVDSIEGTFFIPSSCRVVYDSTGIVGFEVTSMYDMIPDSVGEDKEICDLSTIIGNFSDNMDGVITDGEVTVKEIGLAYVPILSDADSLTYHTIPVWYVIYDQPNSIDGNITREMKVYDAYSGENI